MNNKLAWIIFLLLAAVAGFVAGRFVPDQDGGGTTAAGGNGEREILYWVAPMDANYRRDGPGKSPMGMDLVPVYADEVDSQPGTVKIDPTVVNNLGVRTAKVERGTLSRHIDTVGYVQFDEDTLHHVHTRVEGWIEKLATKATGDPVKKGQLLFELYSPTLVNAQQEFLAALRSNNAVLLQASRERLAALGVTESQIARLEQDRTAGQRVRVYAEADGVVLPGVGAFGACLHALRTRDLEEPTRAAVDSGRPFLGICVGTQMLFDRSEEDAAARGLGLIPGTVRRIPSGPKVPQPGSAPTTL